MSVPTVVVLEEITCVAPLGIRFWDVATARAIGAGLTVQAYPVGVPDLRMDAVVSRHGVYSFRGLPGMRQVENGAGDDAFWGSNPPSVQFTVEVADIAGQYLPFRIAIALPVRGVFGLYESPFSTGLTPDPTWIPVFSAPARPGPGAAAVAYAQLQDSLLNVPAAWALVAIQANGQPPVAGLSDQRGMLTVPFAYPEPRNFAIGSPLRAGGVRWIDQTWPVTVSVLYAPGRAADPMPDLGHTLGQPAAAVSPSSFTLQAGQDLLLRSSDSGGRLLSELLITPAGSPP